jgi:small subunit ribosomal protein S20
MKRNRQGLVRRARNRANKSRVKNVVKEIYSAMEENSVEKTMEALKKAIPVIDRSAVKGTVHKKNASRKVSRLTKQVNIFVSSVQGEA